MAHLSPAQKKEWSARVAEVTTPWILCGLDGRASSLAERLSGMAGVIDWALHGQVSALLKRNAFAADTFALVPGQAGRPHVLIYQYDEVPDGKRFLAQVRRLGIRELSLAESTFPKDFLLKLKQNLGKEDIRCTKLEPESE